MADFRSVQRKPKDATLFLEIGVAKSNGSILTGSLEIAVSAHAQYNLPNTH